MRDGKLCGRALATVWLLSLAGAAWAQGHHAGGGGGGGGSRSGGQSRSAPSSGSATTSHPRSQGDHDRDHNGGGGSPPASRSSTPPRPASTTTPAFANPARASLARPIFSRPYYAFRPRERVGFGLFLGYAVPYPYLYPNAYLYSYPYGYAPLVPAPIYPPFDSSSITVVPSTPAAPATTAPNGIGGVAFQITPPEAAVFVDGVYVGTAKDFSDVAPPLSLAAGRHHFELRAQGYQTVAFDVDVIASQVIPYQGELQLAPP
jgi:hypothetical protein